MAQAIIDASELEALESSWRAIFHDQLEDDPQGTLNLFMSRLAMQVSSNGASEDYADFEVDATLREWVGERAFGTSKANVINVPNKTWEASIKVSRDEIEDDRTGIIEPRVRGLANAVNRGYRTQAVNMLLTGSTANPDAPTFSGDPFFSTSHTVGGEAPASQSNLTVGALTAANFEAARKTMRQLVNHLNEPLEIEPDLLLVGPELADTARDLFDVRLEGGASGAENPNYKAIDYAVVNAFGTNDDWFLVDTSKAVKPLIFQLRRAPEFEAMTAGSEHTFLKNEFVYGTSVRFAFGYGPWQLIHGGIPA